jgi:hypothetical protein
MAAVDGVGESKSGIELTPTAIMMVVGVALL